MLSMLKTTSSYLWAKAPCSFTRSVLHSFIHFQRTRSPISMRLIVNINFRFELAQARWWISVPKIPSTIHLPCGIVTSSYNICVQAHILVSTAISDTIGSSSFNYSPSTSTQTLNALVFFRQIKIDAISDYITGCPYLGSFSHYGILCFDFDFTFQITGWGQTDLSCIL